ncbi:MAG: NADH-quinone oxidoreductase subunit J [Acidimicrobiales bacterium]|nr:NADH-quinone oxidoreductase subunit J [Acidimicrobiales bacterium]
MTNETIVFIVGAAIILTGAIGVVAARNPVHSALFLVQTLFGVAILFVVQDAHFLAAVQVIVYAAAIVILILFVIMLLGVDVAEEWRLKEPIAGQQPLAVVIGAALFGSVIVATIIASDGLTGRVTESGEQALNSAGPNGERFTDIERLGRVLFSDYAMSFEITAGLLTIAVIGAVVLTRTVIGLDPLDDLDPAAMDVPDPAPRGANGNAGVAGVPGADLPDSDLAEVGHPGSESRPTSDEAEGEEG